MLLWGPIQDPLDNQNLQQRPIFISSNITNSYGMEINLRFLSAGPLTCNVAHLNRYVELV